MEQTHENVRHLIEELIVLRQKAPHEIADIYTRNNKKRLKCLKGIKIKLQIDEINWNVPNNPFETINLKQLHQADEKLFDKMFLQIQLLNILNKKKNCIISKIIDDI